MRENLPLDVLLEILSWVPPKFLLRCRCVCKLWLSLISDPSFISLHRHHSPSFLLILFYQRYFDHSPSFLRFGEQFRSLSYYSLPLPSPDSIRTIHHCNGLLCLVTKSSSFIICNPSIQRFLSLPKPLPYPYHHQLHLETSAFGFDSRNHDYKIVRIVLSGEYYGKASRVKVYSLASGFWRTLPLAPVVAPSFIILGSYGFVHGLVHWPAKRWVKEGDHKRSFFFVLSFNFVDEVFHAVELPESVTHDSSSKASITVVRDYNEKALTVYHHSFDLPCSCSIWVMKEYGVVQSWNKIFYFDLTGSGLEVPSFPVTIPYVDFLEVMCITSNGQILLQLSVSGEQRNGNLYLLDVENKIFDNLRIGADFYLPSLSVLYYTVSLVLLNNGALMSY